MISRSSGPFVFTLLLVLFLLFNPAPPLFGEEQGPGGTAANLRSLIERLYGKEVRIEQVRNDNPDYCGEAFVTRDGTPIIKVNIENESKELVIVHELLHLKLRKEGYPRYFVACPADLSLNSEALSSIRRIANDMRDLIEHFSFLFPQMEEMGMDPYGTMRAIYRRNLKSGYVDAFRNPVYQTFNYMKIVLESNDARIAADLERRYLENNWKAPLERGKRLVQAVKKARPGRPEEAAALGISCLNVLFQEDLDFRLSLWGSQDRGSHIERVVEVMVRPAGD